MRITVVSSPITLALVLCSVACGGSGKPAENVDTSSLEGSGSSGGDDHSKDTKDAPPSAAADKPAEGKAATKPGDSDAPASASAPSAPSHPVPSVTGVIDGKPFEPKLARVVGALQKDGRIQLALGDRPDCGSGDVQPGEASLTLVVPWENGYKVDLGSLKRGGKKGAGEIAFARADASGKKSFSATFKPSGTITVVKAPTGQNEVGKLKIDLTSGDYMLNGDLDVAVCVAPK